MGKLDFKMKSERSCASHTPTINLEEEIIEPGVEGY